MHPIDLQHERERRRKRALRPFHRDARLAAFDATPDELVDLERLDVLARLGQITPADAHARVLELRRTQQHRAA